MTETSAENNDSTKQGQTPGQVLRKHREELGLSQQEVANRIRLDIKVIEAIEQDNDEDMPATTYAKGYLRSFAKIVKADAEHIIALYNADSSQQPPEILPEVKPPTQASSSDKPVKAFTYLITLGLVILLLIWYQSNFVVDSTTENNDASENSNTSEEINGVDVSFDVVEHPDTWQTPTEQLATDPAPSTTEITTSMSEIQNDMLELRSDNGEQSLGIISIDSIENTTAPNIADNATVDEMGVGPDTIEMTLSKDSWIEIHDATDDRLFHDLALEGEKFLIRGTAPFNILFGFSPGVMLKLNGEAYDHSRFSNNGIARFTLPEE